MDNANEPHLSGAGDAGPIIAENCPQYRELPVNDKEQRNMNMTKFAGLFPEVAFRDCVLLWIDPPGKHLPVKDYGLLEYYCDEPVCDCRRVLLDVISFDHADRGLASIPFGWESLAFYREWAGSRDLGD